MTHDSTPTLTVFALPKAFQGHTGVIQENAVRSWARHGHAVILMGQDAGIAEMANAVGATYVPEVKCNELGTPLLDSAFTIAAGLASTEAIMYANSDILFPTDPGRAIGGLGLGEYLAVGRRTNVDVWDVMDYTNPGWLAEIAGLAREKGELAHYSAIDYFLMPRKSELTKLPPFAVGRAGWDNWLLARALELGMPLVDLTDALVAVHQNHDYGHVKRSAAGQSGWAGPESDANRQIAAGKYRDLNDCTHHLNADGQLRVDRWNQGRMHMRRAGAGAGAGAAEWVRGAISMFHPSSWRRLIERAAQRSRKD
jgi:hypothetical protein